MLSRAYFARRHRLGAAVLLCHCRTFHTSLKRLEDAASTKKIKLRVTQAQDNREHIFEAPSGITLMEAIRDVGKLDMEAACDGTCACSTCHVILDQASYDKLPKKPSDDEMDMLDLAPSLCNTSRLSCQVTLMSDMDELSLTIPDDGM